MVENKNSIGVSKKFKQVQQMASANTVFEEGDIIVLYGRIKDIENAIKDN